VLSSYSRENIRKDVGPRRIGLILSLQLGKAARAETFPKASFVDIGGPAVDAEDILKVSWRPGFL